MSALLDGSHAPTADELRAVLGKSYPAWNRLLSMVGDRIPPITPVWKFAGAKYGWSLRVVRTGRVILYMSPQPQSFLVSFALGEKAVAAAKVAKLAAPILKAIGEAPRYAEGRGVRISVRGVTPLPSLARLAEINCEQ